MLTGNRVVDAYIEAALWTSEPEPGPERERRDRATLSPQAIETALADCTAFMAHNAPDVEALDLSQVGHDFWLTRNSHGVGFWDRGLGEVGARLTRAANRFGESALYVGDDGLLYFT